MKLRRLWRMRASLLILFRKMLPPEISTIGPTLSSPQEYVSVRAATPLYLRAPFLRIYLVPKPILSSLKMSAVSFLSDNFCKQLLSLLEELMWPDSTNFFCVRTRSGIMVSLSYPKICWMRRPWETKKVTIP